MNVVKEEPILTALTALVVAVVGVLAAFGLAFTTAQTAAIVTLVGVAYGVFALVRSKVTPEARLPVPPEVVVKPQPVGDQYRPPTPRPVPGVRTSKANPPDPAEPDVTDPAYKKERL